MAFSNILSTVGEAGRFQVIHVIFLIIPMMMLASHNLLQNFSAATPRHHCRVPWLENASLEAQRDSPWNVSKESLLRVAIPWEHDSLSKCSRYVRPQWQLMLNDSADVLDDVEIEGCVDGWEFDSSEFSSTIVTEWNLVCEDQGMKQTAQSVYMAGVLIGAIVMGGLADIFGRRNVMLVNNLIVAVTGTSAAFSPSIDAYIVARFLLGLGIMGSYLNAYSLGLEWLDTRHRVLFATTMAYAYTTGQLVLAGLAYAVRDWRSLQLYVSAPYFLFFAFSWFHPESARWLMLQGRYKDALKWFKHVAKINSRNITNDLLNVEVLERAMESSSAPSKKTYTAFHLLKLVELRRRTFIISLIWFATSFCYFGVAMNLQGFKVNIFLLMLIFSAVDFPATLIVLAMISLIGRRAATGTPLLLAGCTCIAVVFIPTDMEMLRTSFAVVGKGAVAGAFNTLFLVAGEIYPTVIRQVGMGTTSTMARVGGMLAPLVTISGEIYPLFPQIIYGGVSLIAGLVAFLLPEMLNKPLADTIEDLKCQKMRKSKRQANEEKAAATSLLVPKTIQESHI